MPYEEYLTKEVAKRYILKQDGFEGVLYIPKGPVFQNKAMLIPAEDMSLGMVVSEVYCEIGITCMVIDVHDMYDVGFMKAALKALKYYGYQDFYLYGQGVLADFCLACACVLEEGIRVIALSALNHMQENIFYERGLLHLDGEFEVEKIKAPVIFLGSDKDSLRNSRDAMIQMANRLRNNKFPHYFEASSYQNGSHYLLPIHQDEAKRVKQEIFHKKQCEEARIDALNKTVDFILNH